MEMTKQGWRVVVVNCVGDLHRPLCSCGWQGERHFALADADDEAREHEIEHALDLIMKGR